jgi:hypothetical protein
LDNEPITRVEPNSSGVDDEDGNGDGPPDIDEPFDDDTVAAGVVVGDDGQQSDDEPSDNGQYNWNIARHRASVRTLSSYNTSRQYLHDVANDVSDDALVIKYTDESTRISRGTFVPQ